ncbi:PEGA domain-containing protein [Candidatus Peregrinibacteria bacterium]|nr:PEGA domain-containing protein [Candidatus Peregrinibacteria bacterium]
MNRWKQLLFVSPFLLAIILIIVWFYVLDKGDVRIQTNVRNATVDSENKTIPCVKKQCLLTLKTGPHLLTIKKDGYHPATKAIGVERNKTTDLTITLLKIAQLISVEGSPRFPAAAGEGNLVFLDPADNRVKIQKKEGVKVITSLINIKGALTFYTSPSEEWTIGQNGADLYLMNIIKGTRQKKPLSEIAYSINWAPDNAGILYNNEAKQIFMLNTTGETRPLNATIDISLIGWIDPQRFIYITVDNGLTSINVFDISSGVTEQLITKTNFLIDVIQWDETQKTTYFHENKEKKWYRLEL